MAGDALALEMLSKSVEGLRDDTRSLRDEIRRERDARDGHLTRMHERLDSLDERLRAAVSHDQFAALERTCTGQQRISGDTDRHRTGWASRLATPFVVNPLASFLGVLLLLVIVLLCVIVFRVPVSYLVPWGGNQ